MLPQKGSNFFFTIYFYPLPFRYEKNHNSFSDPFKQFKCRLHPVHSLLDRNRRVLLNLNNKKKSIPLKFSRGVPL